MSATQSVIPPHVGDLLEFLWSRQPATVLKPADTADLKLVCADLIQQLADLPAVRTRAAEIRERNLRGA